MESKITKSKCTTVCKISENTKGLVKDIHLDYEDIKLNEIEELLKLSGLITTSDKYLHNKNSELNLRNKIGNCNYSILENFFNEAYDAIEEALQELRALLKKEELELLMANLTAEKYSSNGSTKIKDTLEEATLLKVGTQDLENLKIDLLYNVYGVPMDKLKISRQLDVAINIINSIIDELIINKESLMSVLYV